MNSDKQKRAAIDRIAQKISRQSDLSHRDARDLVVKHINRAENKRSQ